MTSLHHCRLFWSHCFPKSESSWPKRLINLGRCECSWTRWLVARRTPRSIWELKVRIPVIRNIQTLSNKKVTPDSPHQWAVTTSAWSWRWAGRWCWRPGEPTCCSWTGGRRRVSWRRGFPRLGWSSQSTDWRTAQAPWRAPARKPSDLTDAAGSCDAGSGSPKFSAKNLSRASCLKFGFSETVKSWRRRLSFERLICHLSCLPSSCTLHFTSDGSNALIRLKGGRALEKLHPSDVDHPRLPRTVLHSGEKNRGEGATRHQFLVTWVDLCFGSLGEKKIGLDFFLLLFLTAALRERASESELPKLWKCQSKHSTFFLLQLRRGEKKLPSCNEINHFNLDWKKNFLLFFSFQSVLISRRRCFELMNLFIVVGKQELRKLSSEGAADYFSEGSEKEDTCWLTMMTRSRKWDNFFGQKVLFKFCVDNEWPNAIFWLRFSFTWAFFINLKLFLRFFRFVLAPVVTKKQCFAAASANTCASSVSSSLPSASESVSSLTLGVMLLHTEPEVSIFLRTFLVFEAH